MDKIAYYQELSAKLSKIGYKVQGDLACCINCQFVDTEFSPRCVKVGVDVDEVGICNLYEQYKKEGV